jgi:hypothetical protein
MTYLKRELGRFKRAAKACGQHPGAVPVAKGALKRLRALWRLDRKEFSERVVRDIQELDLGNMRPGDVAPHAARGTPSDPGPCRPRRESTTAGENVVGAGPPPCATLLPRLRVDLARGPGPRPVDLRGGGLGSGMANLATARTARAAVRAYQRSQAPVDCGRAAVVVAGVRHQAARFVRTLPHRNARCGCLFPRDGTATFHAGYARAFAVFGGVCPGPTPGTTLTRTGPPPAGARSSAYQALTATGTLDRVRCHRRDAVVVEHARCWGQGPVTFEPLHDLARRSASPAPGVGAGRVRSSTTPPRFAPGPLRQARKVVRIEAARRHAAPPARGDRLGRGARGGADGLHPGPPAAGGRRGPGHRRDPGRPSRASTSGRRTTTAS